MFRKRVPQHFARLSALLIVSVLLAGLLGACTSIKYQNRTVRGRVFPVPQSGDTSALALLTINWDPTKETENYYVTYLVPEGEDYGVLWEHELAQFDSWYDLHAAYDEGSVYYAEGTRLLAFSREDGSILWQAPLSDIIWSGCPNCIQGVGDRIIVLTNDYVLQAIDTRDGRPAWSVRLNDSSIAYDGFSVIDEQIVLQDYVSAELHDSAVHIYSPISGSVIQRIAPTCPDGNDPLWYRDSLFLDRSASSGGQVLFLYRCLGDAYMQSWDLASGEPNWQQSLPAGLTSSIDASLLERDTLYLKTYENVFAISLASRQAEVLAEMDPDYDWIPLAEREGVLIGWAERTRGSSRYELWGLDPTGGILWRHKMQADTLAGVDSGSADWTYWLNSQDLILLQVYDDTDEITVETLDLQTGDVGKSTTLELDYAYLEDIAWLRQQAFLTISGQLYAVDLEKATITAVWP